MAHFDKIYEIPTQIVPTEVFRGIDRRVNGAEGVLYDTENISGAFYPALGSRKKRSTVAALTDPSGLLEKDALAYVSNSTLYYNSLPTPVTGLSAGKKQLVSMGAYIVVFPDGKYYNTSDASDWGDLEAHYSYTGTVSLAPCNIDGTVITPIISDSQPEEPANGDIWADSANGVLMKYSEAEGCWSEISPYVRLGFTTQGSIPGLFSVDDAVSISGIGELSGDNIIEALGGGSGESDYVVVTGTLPGAYSESMSVKIDRTVPEMDFVCQCKNRLWGCFYGRSGGKSLNEIYACALGDFKNWHRFRGISTDSYAASVGSDGEWTGAVNYLDSPIFFKENRIHKVTVSPTGAHSIGETVCRGIRKGSHKAVTVVNETLYYSSARDICAYQGGFPESISRALGERDFSDAAMGAIGERLYLSVREGSTWSLYTYDIANGLWYREDGLHAVEFARVDGELYCLDQSGKLIALRGSAGTEEQDFTWSLETPALHYSTGKKKYLGRINLRMSLEQGKTAEASVEYDSSGQWQSVGSFTGRGIMSSFTVPVLPRRCDHMRLKLSGSGEMRLYGLYRVIEKGSEL